MLWLLATVVLGRRLAVNPLDKESSLSKDRDLFAADLPAPAAAPIPDSPVVKAQKFAAEKARHLTDDLKEFKYAQLAKAKAAKEAKELKVEEESKSPAQQIVEAVAIPKAKPDPLVSPERIARLQAAANKFNKASHALSDVVTTEAHPVPKAAPVPKPSAKKVAAQAEQVRQEKAAAETNALKQKAEANVAAFHTKMQGHINEIKTAVKEAQAEKDKPMLRKRRVLQHKAAVKAANLEDVKRQADMKIMEHGWERAAQDRPKVKALLMQRRASTKKA